MTSSQRFPVATQGIEVQISRNNETIFNLIHYKIKKYTQRHRGNKNTENKEEALRENYAFPLCLSFSSVPLCEKIYIKERL